MNSLQPLLEPVKLQVYQSLLIAKAAELNVTCRVIIIDESKVSVGAINAFKNTGQPLGCSVGLDPKDQRISALALIDHTGRCLIVEFSTQLGIRTLNANGGRGSELNFNPERVRDIIQDVLCQPTGFYAFDLAPLALALYRDLGIRVMNGVDIQSVFPPIKERKTPIDAITSIVGQDPDIRVDRDRVVSAFELVYIRNDPRSITRSNLVQRAWISQFLPGFENCPDMFKDVPRIDTTTQKFSDKKLDILSKWASDSVRLYHMKSSETEHSVSVTVGSDQTGSFQAQSMIFKNKLRNDQEIQLSVRNEHGIFNIPAQTGVVEGRHAALNLSREINHSNNEIVGKIISKGRDKGTKAEEKRDEAVLKILQGQQGFGMFDNPWVTNFWDPPNGVMVWPNSRSRMRFKPITVPEKPDHILNTSQVLAIQKMLSFKSEENIVLIRGPPGSGKTSVISRFVEIATASPHYPGIWLVAQSNIAVKNIAEKLASAGYMDWKLLVSKDFIFEWHEHLYGPAFANNLLYSDKFFLLSPSKLRSKLAGCKVILCTLSMLSNAHIPKFTSVIPIHTLIVDEASQIEIGNYLPVFTFVGKRLEKLCLIGDDKQLPPHGQEEIQDLQSVFELEHLHDHIYLLDTQYRMPPQMGDFISSAVYDGALHSNPDHVINDKTIACQFIDIPGVETTKGDSYVNTAEASAVIKLAEFLEDTGKSYRIVTPYDSQRNHIEELMRGNEREMKKIS
ncbi:P-loop containing nucleoside triphosphate hydrolase protein [Lentinula detonsa]|uniref:P-loop containing nucleoside triphosphate hydrolase protein n=1 Tax=Lentinula detonsa TaxID=2804962 RepID=A0A9W8NR82_9AGAR|nr:P-loop containing nucleoside triphosphate hydrolase protein [Lentinula detonsa]